MYDPIQKLHDNLVELQQLNQIEELVRKKITKTAIAEAILPPDRDGKRRKGEEARKKMGWRNRNMKNGKDPGLLAKTEQVIEKTEQLRIKRYENIEKELDRSGILSLIQREFQIAEKSSDRLTALKLLAQIQNLLREHQEDASRDQYLEIIEKAIEKIPAKGKGEEQKVEPEKPLEADEH